MNTTDEDINDFKLLGESQLKAAAAALIKNIQAQKNILVVVDCDCDGYTSSALLINYLHDLFPAFVENHLTYYLHEGKIHFHFLKLLSLGNLIAVDTHQGSS